MHFVRGLPKRTKAWLDALLSSIAHDELLTAASRSVLTGLQAFHAWCAPPGHTLLPRRWAGRPAEPPDAWTEVTGRGPHRRMSGTWTERERMDVSVCSMCSSRIGLFPLASPSAPSAPPAPSDLLAFATRKGPTAVTLRLALRLRFAAFGPLVTFRSRHALSRTKSEARPHSSFLVCRSFLVSSQSQSVTSLR